VSFCRRRIKLRNWVWLVKLERCDLHILREDNTPIIWIHIDSSYQFETRHVSHTQRIKQENSNQKSYRDSSSDVLRLVRRWSRLSRDGVIDVDESCNGCCDRNHVRGIANRTVARIPSRSCRKCRYVGITQKSYSIREALIANSWKLTVADRENLDQTGSVRGASHDLSLDRTRYFSRVYLVTQLLKQSQYERWNRRSKRVFVISNNLVK